MIRLPSIVHILSEVSKEVGAVKKSERNTGQNFNFRGIDQLVLATYPAFVKHGVVMVPEVLEQKYDAYNTGKGARMAWVQVLVRYTFFGPDGDSVVSVVPGEAADSADKGMSKAMSVAKRTALIQVLHLPTDDPDPDSEYEERGAPEHVVLQRQAISLLQSKQIPPDEAAEQFKSIGGSGKVSECTDAGLLKALIELLEGA